MHSLATATPAAALPPAPQFRQNHDLVSRLRQSEIFRNYRPAFEATTGLPLALRAPGAFEAPLHGSKRVNAFCALMASANQTCASCLQLQQRLEQEAGTEARTARCHAGLNETAVPIRVGARVVAYLQTGQVLFQAPTAAMFQQATRQLGAAATPAVTAQRRAAYFQSRVVTPAQYRSIVRLIAIFAQHLAAVSNELMLREAATELPAITRARAFIEAHGQEELTLAQVAQVAAMSSYYFCKVFRRSTGLTFTDYLARRRIEQVKQLLLNPHTRVSEAAFEAGFQSLSQFNRVFRRIAGESPSSFRDHLHGGATGASLAYAA